MSSYRPRFSVPVRVGLASFLAAGALSLGLSGEAAAQGTMKIGVVDIQRAMETTEDGMRATAMLKKLFDAKQVELSRREQDLMKQREELEKQARVLSQPAIQKQMEAWQKQTLELQSTYVEYNKELQKKRVELLYPVQDKIVRSIQRLANNESYDLVVDKATVAFVRSDLDLTDRVIQLANTGGGAPAPNAPPANPPRPAVPGAAPGGPIVAPAPGGAQPPGGAIPRP